MKSQFKLLAWFIYTSICGLVCIFACMGDCNCIHGQGQGQNPAYAWIISTCMVTCIAVCISRGWRSQNNMAHTLKHGYLTKQFKFLSKFRSFWAIVLIYNLSGSKVRYTRWICLGLQIPLQIKCNWQIAELNRSNEHVLAEALLPNFFWYFSHHVHIILDVTYTNTYYWMRGRWEWKIWYSPI